MGSPLRPKGSRVRYPPDISREAGVLFAVLSLHYHRNGMNGNLSRCDGAQRNWGQVRRFVRLTYFNISIIFLATVLCPIVDKCIGSPYKK